MGGDGHQTTTKGRRSEGIGLQGNPRHWTSVPWCGGQGRAATVAVAAGAAAVADDETSGWGLEARQGTLRRDDVNDYDSTVDSAGGYL